MEKLIVARINDHLGEHGLSEEQYGFRQNRSTIQAIERVFNLANMERAKTYKTRKLCLLMISSIIEIDMVAVMVILQQFHKSPSGGVRDSSM